MCSWVVSTPAHTPIPERPLDVLVLASQGGSDQLTRPSPGHTRHAGPEDRILRPRGRADPRRMPFHLDRPSTEGTRRGQVVLVADHQISAADLVLSFRY